MRLNLVYLFYFFIAFLTTINLVHEVTEDDSRKVRKKTPPEQNSFFENSFLSTFKPEASNVNLFSKKLIDQKSTNKIFLSSPRGDIGNESVMSFEGEFGVIDKANNSLRLNEKVKLEKEESIAFAQYLLVNYKTNEALAYGNVRSSTRGKFRTVNIKSNSVKMFKDESQVLYRGNVSGQITSEGKSSFDRIKFKSNLLTLDDVEKIIFLDGEASITRGSSVINALTGNIWLDSYSSGVKYFSMNDDVELTDGFINSKGKPVVRKSFSERLEGFSEEEKLVLSGFPQVEQEGDIIKGNKMIIREEQEMIEIINTNSQFNLDNGGR